MRLADARLLAGYPSAAALADAVGRSPRQVRRWESGESPVPRWLWRLLKAEAGIVPGWPRGWRVRRDGVVVPGLGLVPHYQVESAGYVWQLVTADVRAAAEDVHAAVLERYGFGG